MASGDLAAQRRSQPDRTKATKLQMQLRRSAMISSWADNKTNTPWREVILGERKRGQLGFAQKADPIWNEPVSTGNAGALARYEREAGNSYIMKGVEIEHAAHPVRARAPALPVLACLFLPPDSLGKAGESVNVRTPEEKLWLRMMTTRTMLLALVVVCVLSTSTANAQQQVNKPQLAAQVRTEFLHAWNGYKKYAWGHDDLKPLSKTYHDWYAQSLLMTPVDALDTMILMGLKDEAKHTREYIDKNLSFDKDIDVQNFEITIRLLGGLLSSYQLTRDEKLLKLAEDLGNRLLPVFDSPTGLPYRYVNLKTGKVRGNVTNPAEAGTLLIEFGTLSKLTHKPVFYDKAKRALVEIYKRRSPIGLVGTWINIETGEWTDKDSHISGAIDSYYEYLLKCAILFDDQDCRRMWSDSIAAINQYLRDETKGRMKPELWYGHADMNAGKRTATTYGALDAFFPAVLALSGDLKRASLLQESSYKMWMKHGIEPEEINYTTMEVTSPGYPLRPEIVESTYYLYHYAMGAR